MEAALAGATQYAIDNQQNVEDGKRVVVIFLTDGAPTACNEDAHVIASYAANAYQQHDVLTFVVGLQGSNEPLMNLVAQQGGTTSGYFIGDEHAEAELLQALRDIQQSAITCGHR